MATWPVVHNLGGNDSLAVQKNGAQVSASSDQSSGTHDPSFYWHSKEPEARSEKRAINAGGGR